MKEKVSREAPVRSRGQRARLEQGQGLLEQRDGLQEVKRWVRGCP